MRTIQGMGLLSLFFIVKLALVHEFYFNHEGPRNHEGILVLSLLWHFVFFVVKSKRAQEEEDSKVSGDFGSQVPGPRGTGNASAGAPGGKQKAATTKRKT